MCEVCGVVDATVQAKPAGMAADTESEIQWSEEEEVGPVFPPIQQRPFQNPMEQQQQGQGAIDELWSSKKEIFLPRVKGSFKISTAWGEEEEKKTVGQKHKV